MPSPLESHQSNLLDLVIYLRAVKPEDSWRITSRDVHLDELNVI